jgi:serine/threonine protein kinase
MLRGLKALHDIKIVHRDIKCANIFMTKDMVVKLGDLNVSKVAKGGLLRIQTGTPYYACPEVWKDMPYDHRSDIWSMGCVLYEMIMKVPPFRASTMRGLYNKVLAGKYDPIPGHYSQDLKTMIKNCLQVRSTDRPNCGKLLAMPGLLNHLTGTLDDIEAMKSEQEKLMKTIRMPRKMGEITDRLPKPQYEAPTPKIKRTNSMPSGLAEADAASKAPKFITEPRKPEYITKSTDRSLRSLEASNQHRSQAALLELPHKAILRTNAAQDNANISRSLMEKAHEIHNRQSNSEQKSSNPAISIGNRAQRII